MSTGKVLVVDDDPINIDILKHLLKNMCDLATASNGEEALQKVAEFSPDIVLLDIMMPGMNGYDVCKSIKKNRNDRNLAKVILISAKAMLDERLKGYEAGADDYIIKPFDHEEFLAKVRVFLKLKKVEDELRSLNMTLENAVQIRTKQLVEAEKKANSARAYVDNIIRSMIDPLIVLSTKGTIEKVNKATERLLSYGSEEMMGQPLSSIIAEGDGFSEIQLDKISEGGVFNNRPQNFLSKTGELIPILLSVSIMRDDQGPVSGIVCVAKDMSEQKKGEREKEIMQQQIIQASKLASIGEMAAGIAHEINNPLTIIQGNLELLNDYFVENEATDYLKIISKQQNAVDRITTIVRGMRTYARIDSNETAVINLHEIIEQSIAILEHIYRNEDVKIQKELKSSNPWVIGNAGKFQQVIINFISNARDALEGRKEGLIQLSTEDVGSAILVKIADNGCGIKKEVIKKIFDPFYTSKPVGKGTGLGLSIGLSIINEMHGKIKVDSQIGVGTIFKMVFPIATEKQRDESKGSAKPNSSPEPIYQKFSGNALIVDDEKDITDLLFQFLGGFGFYVDRASNGEEALKKIKQNKYNLLITDLKMPVMDGHELIAAAKGVVSPGLKIVAMTGNPSMSQSDNRIDDTKSLVDALIRKPFLKKDIYKVLKEVVLD